MSEAKTKFPSMEAEHVDIFEAPEDYDDLSLSDFDEGAKYTGTPKMASVSSFEIENDDGKTEEKFRFRLLLVNDADETFLNINVNLKQDGDIQKDVWKKSVLFSFLSSIKELEAKDSMKGKNKIKTVDLKEYRDFVNILDEMTIEVIDVTGKYDYKSFKVLEVK